MLRRPPRSTRTDPLFPYTTLFRSHSLLGGAPAPEKSRPALCWLRHHHDIRSQTAVRLQPHLGGRQTAHRSGVLRPAGASAEPGLPVDRLRSEEHTSELQSLMRISYAVFCLQKKKKQTYAH